MASCGSLLFFLVFFFCFYSEVIPSFVELVCDPTNKGQFNHQSMLKCVVRPTQDIPDLKITLVVWKKEKTNRPFVVFDKRSDEVIYKAPQGYGFADRDFSNMNVSLLISITKVEDEGEYTCQVTTDSGTITNTARLEVTAKYNAPTVRSIEPKDTPHAYKTLICEASGGYPQGQLRWFDENKVEWTKSAKLTVNKTNNGLFELSSELLLLKGSTFSEYTCMVYNASGGKEDSFTIPLEFKGPDPGPDPKSTASTIIAPVVVIGSLIVGLLLALLFFRRRSHQIRRLSTIPLMGTHHELSASDPDADHPPQGDVNRKDSMA